MWKQKGTEVTDLTSFLLQLIIILPHLKLSMVKMLPRVCKEKWNQVKHKMSMREKSVDACWEPVSHAYLPMRFKYRKSSKPASSGFLFRPNITPSINWACTVLPACSFYSFHIICPAKASHMKQWYYNWFKLSLKHLKNYFLGLKLVVTLSFSRCLKLIVPFLFWALHNLCTKQVVFLIVD